jgi:hypothetical protein
MTQYFLKTLPGSPAGKVVHNQVHDLVKRLVPSGELKVVRDFFSLPDQVVLKEEVGADFYH